ncbi:MAG TPA: bacterial proteasome activator family protein [Cellulomonadaceae bacterium]|nr:bacterial proteasome activator family protein [Cellulomonadaceae bacterium]
MSTANEPDDDRTRTEIVVPVHEDADRRARAIPVDGASSGGPRADDARRDDTPMVDTPVVGEPAKVMRIGTMIKQLLEEVRSAPLDEAARARLASVHERSLRELEEGLSADLVAELHRITLPFTEDVTPSDAELRIAQAQLVGWLEGLFHGLQTALVAQQMATQAQLAQMRRALPPGVSYQRGPDGQGPDAQTVDGDDSRPTPGQYL